MKGFFITFEGVDGVGKTTQVDLFCAKLEKMAKAGYRKLREPGGTSICEDIRDILKQGTKLAPIAELFLFNAARNQLVAKIIKPALDAGEVVVCDRFMDSTVAYQCFGNKLDKKMVMDVIGYAIEGVTPSLTIWLDLQGEARRQRAAASRGGLSKYDTANEEFVAAVREGFVQMAIYHPSRVKQVSASGTPEEVHQRAWDVALPHLERWLRLEGK